MEVGDEVRVNDPGSWCHTKTGWIRALDVTSSDGIRGHELQMDGCVTVEPPENLTAISGS